MTGVEMNWNHHCINWSITGCILPIYWWMYHQSIDGFDYLYWAWLNTLVDLGHTRQLLAVQASTKKTLGQDFGQRMSCVSFLFVLLGKLLKDCVPVHLVSWQFPSFVFSFADREAGILKLINVRCRNQSINTAVHQSVQVSIGLFFILSVHQWHRIVDWQKCRRTAKDMTWHNAMWRRQRQRQSRWRSSEWRKVMWQWHWHDGDVMRTFNSTKERTASLLLKCPGPIHTLAHATASFSPADSHWKVQPVFEDRNSDSDFVPVLWNFVIAADNHYHLHHNESLQFKIKHEESPCALQKTIDICY